MPLQLIASNDTPSAETPGTTVTDPIITESACRSAWSETVRSAPFILLIAAIVALSVNLALILLERNAIIAHLNGVQPASTVAGRGL